MTIRNLAKVNNIKQYLDDAIKGLVTKDDIVKFKDFIKEQSNAIKNLTSKITTLEEKVNSSETSVSILNTKIVNLGKKLVYPESQYKARKLDDLEQYKCCECLRISCFEVRDKETKEEYESLAKSYVKDTLKIDIGESD